MKSSAYRKEIMTKINDVNILLWDIETLPYMSFHWGMWKQNIPSIAMVKQKAMLCISYKWLHSTKISTISAGDCAGFAADAYAHEAYIADKFIPILESADFAVAHNGDKFDYRTLKAASVMHGLRPFKVRKVDTLKMAKTAGLFPKGNKLDNLADVLGVARKNPMCMDDWKQIALHSSRAHMDKMERYCEQDVQVLEDVFLKLWPHTESIMPNIHVLQGGIKEITACDRCGSMDYVKNGTYIKNVLVYQRYMCKGCGAAFLGRKAINVKEV